MATWTLPSGDGFPGISGPPGDLARKFPGNTKRQVRRPSSGRSSAAASTVTPVGETCNWLMPGGYSARTHEGSRRVVRRDPSRVRRNQRDQQD
ncbi:hypothetical protein GCM10010306_084150 [Streptomyces umbrinus]|nr:hypothetical protein GCM10010306_084150 [Streptomyces umbrinus]